MLPRLSLAAALLAAATAARSAAAAPSSIAVVADAGSARGLKVVAGAPPPAGALAWATYDAAALLATGWASLSLGATGDAALANATFAGYAAGYVEGVATAFEMEQWCANTGADQPNSKKLQSFLDENLSWMRAQVASNSSAYWQHVGALIAQVEGLADGQADAATAAGRAPLGFSVVYASIIEGGDIFNLGQLYGISAAQRERTPALRRLHAAGRVRVEGEEEAAAPAAAAAARRDGLAGRTDHCSALIRLAPDRSDLWLTHTTWSGLENMLRVAKKFDLPFSQIGGAPVPGRYTAVSSYPTFAAYSSDDFYVMAPSKLVSIETTINNDNITLAEEFASTEVVLEWARNVLANRLATSTAEWAEVFSAYASGTYTNSWMVFDAKRFAAGGAVPPGAFIVLEEMPGNIRTHDRADYLNGQGYWSSYNVASDPYIFAISGQQKLVDKYGGCDTDANSDGCFFTLLNTSRARIFDRGAPGVVDDASLQAMIRYNGAAEKDALAELFCTKAGDASFSNAIADRSDLNSKQSSCFAGGHGDSGGIDAKFTRASWVQQAGSQGTPMRMQSGPTNRNDCPTFSWSNTTIKADHAGLPDVYDFDWIAFGA
jgi:hypothetical protein